jgi:hypothetical protein
LIDDSTKTLARFCSKLANMVLQFAAANLQRSWAWSLLALI